MKVKTWLWVLLSIAYTVLTIALPTLGVFIFAVTFFVASIIWLLYTLQRVFIRMYPGRIKTIMAGTKNIRFMDISQDRWTDEITGDRYITKRDNLGVTSLIPIWNQEPDKSKNPEVIDLSTDQTLAKKVNARSKFSWLAKNFGIYYSFWNPFAYVFRYQFTRNEVKQSKVVGKETEFEFVAISEEVDSLFAKYIYGTIVEAKTGKSSLVKTNNEESEKSGASSAKADKEKDEKSGASSAEQITVTLHLSFSVEVSNCYRALFSQPADPRWLGPVVAALQSGVRGEIGNMTLDELTVARFESDTSPVFKVMREINIDLEKGNPGIHKEVGMIITSINLLKYKLTDAHGKLLEDSATAVYVAERKAKADVVSAEAAKKMTMANAEATAYKTTTEGTAEATKIEAVGKATAAKILAEGMAAAQAQEKFFEARAKHDPKGDLARWIALENTSVSTYVEGGGKEKQITLFVPAESGTKKTTESKV